MTSPTLDTTPVQIVIVADSHGLATDDYTFPYVAVWAGEDGAEVVQASASRVAAAAREIITRSTVAHTFGGNAARLVPKESVDREDVAPDGSVPLSQAWPGRARPDPATPGLA